MFSFFRKLSLLGTNDSFSTLTNRRITLCNRLCVFCIIITLFFSGFYYSIHQIRMVEIEIIFIILYSIPIPLNYFKLTTTSRIYFNILILFQIFFLTTVLGKGCNMYEFFIPTIMAPFALFEFSQKRIISLLSLINIILVSLVYAYPVVYINSGVNLTANEIALLNKMIFYIAIVCCAVIIYALLYVNEKTTRQLDIDNETLRVQLEAIFNNSADAIFLATHIGKKIVKVNKRAIEMFEATDENYFFNKEGLELRKDYPTDDYVKKMGKILSEKGLFEDEVLYKTRTGKEFWCAISTKLIKINGEMFHSVRLTDITEQKIITAKTDASLKEKELLLGEIHHRVKNNLAIISALINLQIDNLKDDKSKIIFEETKDRIYSMALIHNQLYLNSSFAQIEFAKYISNFCSYLIKSYQTNLNIEIIEKTDPIFLDIKTAIPCALILNELVTNAFKHAFKNQPKGVIEIGLRKENEQIVFYVSDTGLGMDNAQLQSSSMGMSLITSLIEQIDGKLEYKNEKGSMFLITFPGVSNIEGSATI